MKPGDLARNANQTFLLTTNGERLWILNGELVIYLGIFYHQYRVLRGDRVGYLDCNLTHLIPITEEPRE